MQFFPIVLMIIGLNVVSLFHNMQHPMQKSLPIQMRAIPIPMRAIPIPMISMHEIPTLMRFFFVAFCFTRSIADLNSSPFNLAPGHRNPHRPALPRHRKRVEQDVQQRRLSLLLHALPHVHRAHADRTNM